MLNITVIGKIIEDGIEYDISGSGTKSEEIICWKNKDINGINEYSFDLVNNIFVKDNKNLKLIFPYMLNKETQATLLIKENNVSCDVPFITQSLEKKTNNISIKYLIKGDNFTRIIIFSYQKRIKNNK